MLGIFWWGWVMLAGGLAFLLAWVRFMVTSVSAPIVTKELASWDKVKELGFDDVLEWERAFEKATGALPEGSKVKELQSQAKAEWEKLSGYGAMRHGVYVENGAPIPVSGNRVVYDPMQNTTYYYLPQ